MTDLERDALRAWLDLLTASNTIKKQVDAALRRDFGMSISRFDLLSALDRAGANGLRASDLSKKMLVTEGATTQVASPLIADGYIKRTPCENDGRVAMLALTKKGQKLFQKMALVHRGWINGAFGALTPSQIASLRQLLRKLDIPHRSGFEERGAA